MDVLCWDSTIQKIVNYFSIARSDPRLVRSPGLLFNPNKMNLCSYMHISLFKRSLCFSITSLDKLNIMAIFGHFGYFLILDPCLNFLDITSAGLPYLISFQAPPLLPLGCWKCRFPPWCSLWIDVHLSYPRLVPSGGILCLLPGFSINTGTCFIKQLNFQVLYMIYFIISFCTKFFFVDCSKFFYCLFIYCNIIVLELKGLV